MSVDLESYNEDGACVQAHVLLALLRPFNVQDSWCSERGRYLASINVNRWHNYREQGYTLSMGSYHVTFFEHRNSDTLCFLVYEYPLINPPTIETLPAGAFPDKWTHAKTFKYGEWLAARDYVEGLFNERWRQQNPR